MITGDKLWPAAFSDDLIRVEVHGVSKAVFQGAPPDFYSMLLASSAAYPNKTFIINENGRPYTFADILNRTDAFANYLYHHAGIRRGHRAALMLYNGVEFCVAFLALVKLGAVCVSLPTKNRPAEIDAQVRRCQPSAIICEDVFADWFGAYKKSEPGACMVLSQNSLGQYGFCHASCGTSASIPYIPRAGDPAVILYTSGTASQSKGVLLHHYNMVHAVLCYQRAFGLTEKDSTIIPVPMYYVTGLIALFGVFLYCAGTLYLHRFFSAARVLADSYKGGVTFLHASPTVFSLLLQQRESWPQLPRLRTLACGGGSLPKATIARLHDWLPEAAIRPVYGLTETASPATIFPHDASDDPHIGSSGIPIPGLAVRILDENGKELPALAIGEICLKGTVILESYFQLASAKLKDGWLSTGDLGYLKGDYLYVVDRKTDMINRGGEKIWSPDVENELLSIPGIVQCAVIGLPDDLYGEVPVALVQPQPNMELTERAIQELLRKRLARFKVPTRIYFTSEIPMTANAKIDKKAIRAFLQARKGKE